MLDKDAKPRPRATRKPAATRAERILSAHATRLQAAFAQLLAADREVPEAIADLLAPPRPRATHH